ncbi:hypothetical protein CEH05_08095 [Halobacillus halophilus]|uniref:Uncharacterized protein n=1 Tax=Halobacillus halophilus (strain ATCC 35676 / DSM 2266 / JCM 20832 / KCTC 3685 / LMG 17431 / NBRC 102448 / NCIMB 2269) TaxID=866895 RepID=I0JLE3_HALH3|nr:hypothetical protein [Halobacillus halophilus]ASF39076.1 hypothetical protein CEH05_08095 [Halobacillus halophilus]CCG44963.1 conserved hypothetical protein [Halobacillus halophilus DSM 2266]
MQKKAKYISRSLLLIAGLLCLMGLFTDSPFSWWMNVWLFLAPAMIIREFIEMPAKGKSRIYSMVCITALSLVFGMAVLDLIIG